METDQLCVFTIGHSNHPIGKFIELLRLHRIDALADVRSAPASRFHPQFNRKPLAESLKQAGFSSLNPPAWATCSMPRRRASNWQCKGAQSRSPTRTRE